MPRRNSSSRDPSVVVPSGKLITGTPAASASRAFISARTRLAAESRWTKITPSWLAAVPMIGQEATSLFAIGAHGTAAAIAIASR